MGWNIRFLKGRQSQGCEVVGGGMWEVKAFNLV